MEEFTRLAGSPWLAAAALFVGLAPLLLLGLALPYAVLRLRDSRAVEHDPELGLKAALYYTYSLALLVLLAGATLVVIDMVLERRPEFEALELGQPGERRRGGARPAPRAATPPRAANPNDPFTPRQRVGAGMAAAGLGVALAHLVLIVGFTNTRQWPEARRVFAGWRLGVSAVVVLAAVTALSVALFQSPRDRDVVRVASAVLAVWVPSWMIHLGLLQAYSRRRRSPPTPAAEPAAVR